MALEKLSARENELLRLLVDGHSRVKISSLMGISKYTYDSYRGNIRIKLNIHNQGDWARTLSAFIKRSNEKKG